MNVRFWLLALVVMLAVSSGCGDESTKVEPTAAPASTLAASPESAATAEPAVVGPLVVYSFGSQRYVALYDVGAGREIRHADTLDDLGYVEFNPDQSQWTGGTPRVVAKSDAPATAATPGTLSSLTVYSPDRGMGVFVTRETNFPTSTSVIRVFDVKSTATLLELPFPNPYSDGESGRPYFRGVPTPIMWRDDGKGFIVLGNSSIDGPTGWATVMLDGTVRIFKTLLPVLSPTGRAAAITDAGLSLRCDLDADNHRIRIRDLVADVDSAMVTSERSIVPVEWSPDGDQLLYGSYSTRPPAEEGSFLGARRCVRAVVPTAARRRRSSPGGGRSRVA